MFSDMGTWDWGMGFGWLFMILFWALVILGIAAIIRWLTGTTGTVTPPPIAARQILEECYVRGEIDRDEFEQKKHDLEQ